MAKSTGKGVKKKALEEFDGNSEESNGYAEEEEERVDESLEEGEAAVSTPKESSYSSDGVDLTELDGVGPSISEKLHEGGYNTYEAISVASPKELAAASGIGEATAQKIILSARSKLNIGFTTAEKVLNDRKNVKRCTTGSEKLDAIIGGGLETRSIVELFGEFRTGKTQIAHQACVTVQMPYEKGGLEGAALYVDSEGTFRPERLLQIAERYQLNGNEILQKVHYARAYNSDHQILIIDSAVKLILEKNIKLIVVDSVMSHFRAEYVGRGTLSERQQKLNKFLHKLLQTAEAYNLIVLITNQVMDSPGVFFGDPTRPVGGHVLAHTSTYRLYLRKSKGNKRIARLIDSPCLPEGEAIFEITERGVEDP
jgi:DNA repair protein RadA